MKSNDVKKGMTVQLRDGRYAEVLDNKRTTARRVRCDDEVGEVPAYNWVKVQMPDGSWEPLELTDTQKQGKTVMDAFDALDEHAKQASKSPKSNGSKKPDDSKKSKTKKKPGSGPK